MAQLRGVVPLWISFGSWFLTIGLALKTVGTALAIGLGVFTAIVTSVLVLWTGRVVAQTSVRRRGMRAS